MSWSLKGSHVETCSCDLICRCKRNHESRRDLRLLPRRQVPGHVPPRRVRLDARRGDARINAFGGYEGKTGLSTSEFSWAA
jgi:hypothetical protein